MIINLRDFATRNKHLKQRQTAPTEQKFVDFVGLAESNCLKGLFNNVKRMLASYRDTVSDEWKSLVAFWRDPDCAETPVV